MNALSRTNSTFTAPAPRAIGEPNMSLEHDHRQEHPAPLYTDHSRTHFNTPNGVVDVPRPLTLGSDDWKIAQFTQKQCEAETNGTPLSSSQIKRFKTAINKTARDFIDKAHEAQVTQLLESQHKQFRKEQKKQRHLLKKQQITQAQLRNEADTLFSQCELLNLSVHIAHGDTDQSVIQKCQHALLEYQNTPLTKNEAHIIQLNAQQELKNISADARASEIFKDVKTGHVSAEQTVYGEDTPLPKKKKKKNTTKKHTPPSKISQPTPEISIDWGDSLLSQSLTKKQQREIALNNKTANSA